MDLAMNLSPLILSLNEFKSIAHDKQVFDLQPERNKTISKQVADFWYSFSNMIPSLLAQSANELDRPSERETLLTIAAEENGEVDGIPHFKMFSNACSLIGIDPQLMHLKVLEDLMIFAQKSRNHQTLGLCFGLEVIANENISFLLKSLSNNSSEFELLSVSTFFEIHRSNEDTHIDMNFKNFQMFCITSEEKSNFMSGFDYALAFWKSFWFQATNVNIGCHEFISE
jgi:hypothetical protein